VPLIETIGHTLPLNTMLVHSGQDAAVGTTVKATAVAVMVPLNGPVPTRGSWNVNVPAIARPFWVIPFMVMTPEAEAVVL
jgi:hypothetical protein